MVVSLQRLIISPEQLDSDQIQLTLDQQHYLRRVLRLSAGQPFIALDGKGNQWTATLNNSADRADILHQQVVPTLHRPAITLAIAIPKGGGFDDLVRQTTELGVTTIQPLITERTLHRPNPKKQDRWQRIAAEATEQSERGLLPTILPPQPWEDFVQQASGGRRYICVARRLAPHLLTQLQQPKGNAAAPITLATGPEGGWTAEEVDLAIGAGFSAATLGSQILRAVTAPLAALAIAMAAIDTTLEAESQGSTLRSDSQ